MRPSVLILIFLVLFNGWAGLMQEYGIDDHVGISAEPGDSEKLDRAIEASKSTRTGNAVGGTLLGMYNALGGALESMLIGIQPGAQMLINIVPDGVAEDIIVWVFSIVPIISAIDILAFFRGGEI